MEMKGNEMIRNFQNAKETAASLSDIPMLTGQQMVLATMHAYNIRMNGIV